MIKYCMMSLTDVHYRHVCWVGKVEYVIPENIHTPPHGWSMEIPRGRGGLKGRNFQGVQGVPTRIIFHRVVKDTIDHTRHKYMWIILICSKTKIRRCPLEKKKLQNICLKHHFLCWEFDIISAVTICPHALTTCSNALMDCSYDLTVDSKQLMVGPSNI